jgi:hypothetical protein
MPRSWTRSTRICAPPSPRSPARRKVEVTLDLVWRKPPTHFDPKLVDAVENAAKALGYSHRRITSGAGHDACNLNTIMPAAMVFVPCKDGVSHNELEDATQADCTAGRQRADAHRAGARRRRFMIKMGGRSQAIRRISVRGVFVDANGSLADIFERQNQPGDPPVRINRDADITADQMPALLDGARSSIIDHTPLPTEVARRCAGLKHVVFLGTGARSYMNPEELAELGIEVHLIKGYGDTAVAECAIALMWAAARGIAQMDREMRAGNWLREDGMQLTGKTLGLIGFGGIAAEVARIALGSGMRVLAWNRSPKSYPGVEFVDRSTRCWRRATWSRCICC